MDLSKIESLLGFNPKYDFQKGITEFVKWVKNKRLKKTNMKNQFRN